MSPGEWGLEMPAETGRGAGTVAAHCACDWAVGTVGLYRGVQRRCASVERRPGPCRACEAIAR